MGNEISLNSALLRGSCSARNITWQYLHNQLDKLPEVYASCPSAQEILNAHCCCKGICQPNWGFDKEFRRYGWHNWDGLGNPLGEGEEIEFSWWCSPFFYGGWSNITVAFVDGKPIYSEGDHELKMREKFIEDVISDVRDPTGEEKNEGSDGKIESSETEVHLGVLGNDRMKRSAGLGNDRVPEYAGWSDVDGEYERAAGRKGTLETTRRSARDRTVSVRRLIRAAKDNVSENVENPPKDDEDEDLWDEDLLEKESREEDLWDVDRPMKNST